MREAKTTRALAVDHGFLIQLPVSVSSLLGMNYWASLEFDPSAEGGIKRVHWEKVKSITPRRKTERFYVIPEGLAPGTPVEFVYERRTVTGRVSRSSHWFGVVLEIHEDRLIVSDSESPKAALQDASKLRVQSVRSAIEKLTAEERIKLLGDLAQGTFWDRA